MVVDVDALSDAELRTKLLEFGFPVMPITGTTRKVMAKKLKMLLENKNKIGDGSTRRSMGKYSSEEDSDVEVVSAKKKENRRATMATPPVMQPPPPAASVVQDEFDTGSDSESDLVTNSYRSSPTKPGDDSGGIRDYFTRESPSKNLSRSSDISYGGTSQSLSESRYNSPSLASDYANDRLNQIRNRLSLNVPSSYERPTSSYTSTLDKEETPFLSHFTRRLSALSSSQKNDDYKNDIIKEHDANGSTSLYARSPMGSYRSTASRPTASAYGFKINQPQKNSHWSQGNAFIKNNVVSFAVLAGAALFFIFLAIAYLGMRSDTSVIPSDAVVPYCIPNDHSSKKGVNCLLREEAPDAFNLLSIIRGELHRRAVDAKCNGHLHHRTHMTEDDIVKFCLTNFHTKEDQVKRDLTNIEILIFNNPEWHLSVLILDQDRDTVTGEDIARDMEQVIFNRDVKSTVALIQLKPDLPWSCTLYNGVKVAITASIVIIAFTVALYGSKWLYKRYTQYEHRQRMELTQMVERILELLQQACVSDGATEDGEHGKEKLWQKAIQFINENESRVRTEVQEVKGEPFEVWRWIGSSNLSSSRCEYRTGRRIVDVQYLINETLKFPHKKMRFCENTDVEVQSELREGFRSILLLYCKNCKKEHAVCTEDPGLDTMNVNVAFISGIISLGLSLYHLNELCNFLQIPTVSGKEYNIYLDEIFEVYKDSTKDSESNISENILRTSTPNKEDDILTSILPDFDESGTDSTAMILRSSVLTPSQKKEDEFLKRLAKTPEQIQRLAEETRNQKDSPIWIEERKIRLTASNFGKVCKLRPSTNKDKVAETLSPPGSPNTAGPASWQGQAFETDAGAVNSLPCSPTTCLKVRGITEEGGGASKARLDEAREAVLLKCAHRCRILHCQADQNTGCVYLKYAGHLVTVKYLRLERYMQRFPNSPASGPPFLNSLTPAFN
nr:unnamed protein product [Callosobruchus analis]